ncbi:MAG: aspartate aminotransferase family protein [Caldiserica bacterium]|jgi:4-aminobutyrate aminotransferase-like enzyme|nr:aspartate aminotransferase family protein [Caldisericota bacterium]MDH7561769.1 aspartate aminotransferase family protein [Caldisericota bacterium]
MNLEELEEKRKKYLMPCYAHYFQEMLLIERGERQYLFDGQGKRYLDCFAGVAVVNCGHAHPLINQRAFEQMQSLVHISSLMLSSPMVLLAEKLAQITPGDLNRIFFCNSGAEAVEGATALVKAFTDNHQFIALRSSFHGRTLMALSLTAQKSWRGKGPYAPGVIFVANPYCYRCTFNLTYPSCGLACAEDVEMAIESCTNGEIGGFIAEPVQGNGGVIVPPMEYFGIVGEIVHRHGGLFIDDDVQCGFGRTGEWFGIQNFNVIPDLMTLGKGMANGLPLGAFVSNDVISRAFKPGQHFSTFGGNPVNCAAALATLEVLKEENLISNSRRVGEIFLEKLKNLEEKHPSIGEVRGLGLLIGVELVKDKKTKEPYPQGLSQILEFCRENGLLIGKAGPLGNVIRITPPLCFTEENVEEACEILERGLRQIEEAL